VGGRADAAELARLERRLDQIGGVHRAVLGRACADHRVDLVDEEDGVGPLLQLVEDPLQPLFEVTAELGAGQETAHVQGVDHRVLEDLGDLLVDDPQRQALGDGGLANAGFTDQKRVVLAAPAEHLHGPLDLQVAADQGIDATGGGLGVEVHREGLEGVLLSLFVAAARGGGPVFADGFTFLRHLGDAVGDEANHVEAGDALLLEQVHRVAVRLPEEGDEQVGRVHQVFAGGLDVHHRTLEDALERQGLLGILFNPFRQGLHVGLEEGLEIRLEGAHVTATGPNDLVAFGIVQERVQDVLQGHELMASAKGFVESRRQGVFELLRVLHHSLRLDRNFQREVVLSGGLDRLSHLGLGDLPSENTRDANPILVHVHHDAKSRCLTVMKDAHQRRHDKFHGRVVVVVEKHLVHRRLLGALIRLLDGLGVASSLRCHRIGRSNPT
jgi:hypothetical protein